MSQTLLMVGVTRKMNSWGYSSGSHAFVSILRVDTVGHFKVHLYNLPYRVLDLMGPFP